MAKFDFPTPDIFTFTAKYLIPGKKTLLAEKRKNFTRQLLRQANCFEESKDNANPFGIDGKKMKDENKFLSRSRERSGWKKKLAIMPKKEAKAEAMYFRPNLTDNKRIRELAEMTGETKNSIVEKLVAVALHNKTLTTQKLEEQKTSFRRLEDKTADVADNQIEIVALLKEIRERQTIQEKFTTSLLREIYCMVHTAVSLLRTVLLQILGPANNEMTSQPPSPRILAMFDETADLTIARSLQDLESTCAYHEIKDTKFTGGNLFWKSKLRKTDSAKPGA